jgi:homoserine dehydrogenase
MPPALSASLFATNFEENILQTLPKRAPQALRVGLLGLGTVGSGTFAVLERNQALIAARAGRPIRVTMVAVRNTARAAQIVGQGMVLSTVPSRVQPRLSATQARPGQTVILVNDPFAVVNHPDIDVVVEAMGGTTLAKQLVLQAIANGKHVVTANKALLAEHGDEVFAAAQAKGVIVAYEGAVAVSIPIIKALREGLSANRIEWVAGIVNGTSNFILSAMRDQGQSFDAALAQAQALGFAEADPAFDVEGIDAAHKLALLASNAFGVHVPFKSIHVEGITALEPLDMACAQALGYVIKLLAIAKQTDNAMELRVHPVLLPESHLLAHVNASMNAVMVKGNASGVTMYCGAGAGAEQTGSAVIADLVDVARTQNLHAHQRVPYLGFEPQAMRRLPIRPMSEVPSGHYLRLEFSSASPVQQAADLTRLMDVLTQHGLVIERREVFDLGESSACAGAAVLLTQSAPEACVRKAVAAWEQLAEGPGQVHVLRVGFGA